MVEQELYKKHRPMRLSELYGQKAAVALLQDLGRRNAIPHCLLLSGPSGCGKTTIARILKTKLRCSDSDFAELNCAGDARGIDTIREIRSRMGLSPMGGDCRIWLLDECFAAGTSVETVGGPVPIEKVIPGDQVRCITGYSPVLHLFANRVSLDRLVRLQFFDGREIYTTTDHLFLTQSGWTPARNLSGLYVFSQLGYTMGNLTRGTKNEDLRVVWCGVQTKQSQAKMLQQELWSEATSEVIGERSVRGASLPVLRDSISGQDEQHEEVLQPFLCQEVRHDQAGVQGKDPQREGLEENQWVQHEVLQDHRWSDYCTGKGTHVTGQICFPGGYREVQGYQREERDFARLEGYSRWEWQVHHPTIDPLEVTTRRLGVGSRCADRLRSRGIWLPEQLQGGHWSLGDEGGHRGGWFGASVEGRFVTRCEEDGVAQPLRVDRVEVYQRGCNEASFAGVVRDQDRLRGYVTFYDLQVQDHPSYFANGVVVHNCHKLTGDAQTALLKMLEDTPSHAYFILATTDPQKLNPTIRTRATEIVLKSLDRVMMNSLLKDVMGKEGTKLSKDVVDKIVQSAEGSPRKALVILNQVMGLEMEEDQLGAAGVAEASPNAIKIARLLMDPRTKWPEMAAVLKEIDEDAEGLRYMVLGYAQSVMLGGGKAAERAYQIVLGFQYNFFDSKRAGLVAACYGVLVPT